MIKLFICCALCTSTLLASLELQREKERLADTSEELSEIIGRMISMLRFESADVFAICHEVFDDKYPVYRDISAGDFHTLWKSACKTLKADAETVRIFSIVGETLGTSDTLSQTERLSILRDDLHEHAKELKRKASETKKLYTTLGALSGLAAVIMII